MTDQRVAPSRRTGREAAPAIRAGYSTPQGRIGEEALLSRAVRSGYAASYVE
jgi:hypothetical protein